MHILQLIGLLLVFNALACAGWAQYNGKLGAGGIGILAFALIAGLVLTFHRREVEVSFGKDGAKLKAAAEQATVDAAEIAAIRKRVESQAATMDLVAHESAQARKLLDGLREQNKTADEKLKLLEEKTSDIVRLPDGRLKTGATVAGEPSVLAKRFEDMSRTYDAGQTDLAYESAHACIRIYEDTKKFLTGPHIVAGGDVEPVAMSRCYAIAAEAALRRGDPAEAVRLHGTAVKMDQGPERMAYHVAILAAAGQKAEAETLLRTTLARNDQFAADFKAKAQSLGLLKE